MNSVKIIANGVYLPNKEVNNNMLNAQYKLDENWIFKRTGIQKRWYEESLTIEEMAINSVKNLIDNFQCNCASVGAIIVATTSTNKLMPSIANEVQKFLKIDKCICLDILAGCSGYINAFDIARKYIALGEVKNAIVIGVEKISSYLDEKDLNTTIILGDAAGATLIEKSDESKIYMQNIVSTIDSNNILGYTNNSKLNMDGKSVYKYATTDTVENVKEIVKKANLDINKIKYIIPHQSNKRILDSIAQKLDISKSKMYSNILNIGNTFCASIPIALKEMFDKKLIKAGDFVILLGYGGGLNTGSILLEI